MAGSETSSLLHTDPPSASPALDGGYGTTSHREGGRGVPVSGGRRKHTLPLLQPPLEP